VKKEAKFKECHNLYLPYYLGGFWSRFAGHIHYNILFFYVNLWNKKIAVEILFGNWFGLIGSAFSNPSYEVLKLNGAGVTIGRTFSMTFAL
jgi:hypothetical protein